MRRPKLNRKVIAALAAVALSCSLFALEPAPKETATHLRVDPLLVAQATEVWSVIAQPDNPVWPGWNASDTPLLFYLPGIQDVLINHPKPPAGFRRYSGSLVFPGAEIHVRDGTTFFEFDGQNTALDVAGATTLVVADTLSNRRSNVRGWLQDPRAGSTKAAELTFDQLQGSPYDSICMIAHEAFHAYQKKQASKKGGSEEALTRYPTIASKNTLGLALEGDLLAEALRSTKPEEVRAHAIRWLAVRNDRRKGLTPDAASYEDRIEYLEGLAKYVEYRLLEVLEGRAARPAMIWQQGFHGYADLRPQRERLVRMLEKMMRGEVNINNDPYGASPMRMRLYYSGMAIGVLLDRLSPNWKQQMFAPESTLTGLASRAINATEVELMEGLAAVKQRPSYTELAEKKKQLEKEGNEATQKLFDEIEKGPKSALVIDYSALGEQQPGLSFTPFGILRVDDHRTIYRLIPITATVGATTLKQTVATPLLHDRAGKRFVCQLQDLVSADKVESLFGIKAGASGSIELKEVTLPGLRLKGGYATVSTKDRVVELRLSAKPSAP